MAVCRIYIRPSCDALTDSHEMRFKHSIAERRLKDTDCADVLEKSSTQKVGLLMNCRPALKHTYILTPT